MLSGTHLLGRAVHFFGVTVRKSSSNSSSCKYMEKVAMKSSSEAEELSDGDKNKKLKDKLCYGGGGRSAGVVIEDADLLASWPPRYYTCSFCTRRFKSAQALGGHMNVHRRARAILRSQSISPIPSPPSSPWLIPNTIITPAHHQPLQGDNHHFILPNPNRPHWPLSIPHHTSNIPSSHSYLSHLPMITSITSSCSSTCTPKNPLFAAAAFKHVPDSLLFHTGERAKKSRSWAETKINGGLDGRNHQDDAVMRLSLGTGGLITRRSAADEDIDLELRLGF